ncbi:NAD(P)-dependent oxidoreductase [Rhodobacteraceae bacterium D3-12]|nr:NAD(P)-dependent oxidoreductase [Rhodobacteraceae bacterium D3-12]
MKRFMITGANGSLGQDIIAHFMQGAGDTPVEITALDREVGATLGSENCKVNWHGFDLTQGDIAAFFRATRFDAVLHLAAITGQAAEDDPAYTTALNFETTRNLQALCAAADTRFVFTSSIGAIGDANGISVADETTPCAPRSQYGQTKHKSEQFIGQENADGEDCWALRLPTLLLRQKARTGLPTTGFLSDISRALFTDGQAMSPMRADYKVAVASIADASRALIRLATQPIPEGTPAVLNLPAYSATPADILAVIREFRDCSLSYPDENNERILSLTGFWPGSLVSCASDLLGVANNRKSREELRKIMQLALPGALV